MLVNSWGIRTDDRASRGTYLGQKSLESCGKLPKSLANKPLGLVAHLLPMYDLTGFQRDLLYVIAGTEKPHGLAIKDELEAYYEQEIHHGRLYPNLDTLVEKGLVEKGELDKRTNYYTVTRRGSRELTARKQWERQYLGTSETDP